ncbi:MAG TPA: hypothetical protein DHW07_00490 [Gammaproteobacteria bacterium]|nr:hypothetical protein [Gammaproteobacteria bacterium]
MPFKFRKFWYASAYYDVRGADGQIQRVRIKKKIGIRKADAVDAEATIRAQVAAGTYEPGPVAAKTTSKLFADFCIDDFLPWSAAEHSANHHNQQRRFVVTRLIPYMDGLRLNEITTKMVEDYKRVRFNEKFRLPGWRKSKKTKPGTVNRELFCLKAIFRQALKWGDIDISPAANVTPLKETENPPRLLSGQEITRLLEAMPDHLRAVVGVAVYAGLRSGEVKRLKWQDIDFKNAMLSVVSRYGMTTKNNDTRHVPLSSELAELLRQHPHRLGSKIVFASLDGGYRHDFRKSLKSAAKAAGIEKVTMHQLRHCFCSHAQMSGVDARTVQKWMGHASITTTLKYSHVAPDHEQAAIQRLKYGSAELLQKEQK